MSGTTFAFARAPRTVVTGGASGIGLGVSRRLLELGGRVAVADLPEALARLNEEDRPDLVPVPMDVTDEASVRDGLALAARRLGTIDSIVNSAGVCRLGRLEDVATAEWKQVIDVNLTGTFLVLREALPYLLDSGSGRVVNLASNAGKRGYPMMGAYCASKFGVVGLTQALAAELGVSGIRVNAVCPATVAETPMGEAVTAQRLALGFAGSSEELAARRLAAYPLGRVGTVADVTEAVLFLLSDSSAWITGESLNVDGGSLAG